MFSRAVVVSLPSCTQVRGMATLKDISMRLKAVTNIQKITKSMKIVSAAKFARAEKGLKPSRAYGAGAQAFFEKAELPDDSAKPNHLILAMSSDKGLCGGIHAGIARSIRNKIAENTDINYKIICIGDKQRAALQRFHGDKIVTHFTEVGRKPPTFADAAFIANAVLNSDVDYDHTELYYNVFKTVVSYNITILPLYTLDQISRAEKINVYDSIDDDVLQSYREFSMASLIYFTLKEGSVSELSARMTAMDGASKSAGEVIDKLALAYNRKRQSVITTELIEIISGAAALE